MLRGTPELGSGRHEFDAHARPAADAFANVHDAAFLLGLIAHVREKQALAIYNDGFHRERAAVFVRVDRFGFFVKRLLVGVRAVDEKRNLMGVAQAAATVHIVVCGVGPASGWRRRGIVGAQPVALRLLQGLPDAAQLNLPGNARILPVSQR